MNNLYIASGRIPCRLGDSLRHIHPPKTPAPAQDGHERREEFVPSLGFFLAIREMKMMAAYDGADALLMRDD